MLENTQFKELKLNVNKTNMVKLCKFYFHEILNKKIIRFSSFSNISVTVFMCLNVVVMNFIYLLIVAKFF